MLRSDRSLYGRKGSSAPDQCHRRYWPDCRRTEHGRQLPPHERKSRARTPARHLDHSKDRLTAAGRDPPVPARAAHSASAAAPEPVPAGTGAGCASAGRTGAGHAGLPPVPPIEPVPPVPSVLPPVPVVVPRGRGGAAGAGPDPALLPLLPQLPLDCACAKAAVAVRRPMTRAVRLTLFHMDCCPASLMFGEAEIFAPRQKYDCLGRVPTSRDFGKPASAAAYRKTDPPRNSSLPCL